MIKILNSELKPVAVLKTVINPVVIDEINREFICSFTTVIDGEKSQYINYLHKVETDNNYFNIMYTKENHNSDGSLTINVECEHVSYELNDNDNILDYFTAYGTPTELLTLLLYGTDFTIGQVQFTEPITISINEKCTKRGVLFAIADALGAEVEFNKYQISLLSARGEDRGVCFRYRKNLLNVSRTTDAREKIDGFPLVTYEINVAELEFAEGYGSDWHYETGDIVRVFDAELGINNLPLRIIKESHNPNNRMQGTVVVSNIKDAFIHDIYDTLTNLQQNSIMKESVYNGCHIGPQNGFEAIRSDNKVKSTLNATEGISVKKGDGSGTDWSNAFYVDVDGNIRLKDAFIELVTGVVTMLLNPAVGIKISDTNGDLFSVDTVLGQLNMNGNLTIKQAGNKLMQVFKDVEGGKISIFDNNQLLNVKIGVEAGTADNIGGTLVLYIDSPYENPPNNIPYSRVELGISGAYGAGIVNLRDNNAVAKINIYADSNVGPVIGIRDDAGNLKTYFIESSGFINNERVATRPWVSDQGYATQSWVQSQGYSTYTGPGNSYVHSQNGEDISLAVTDAGIVVRRNGVTLGSIFYD